MEEKAQQVYGQIKSDTDAEFKAETFGYMCDGAKLRLW